MSRGEGQGQECSPSVGECDGGGQHLCHKEHHGRGGALVPLSHSPHFTLLPAVHLACVPADTTLHIVTFHLSLSLYMTGAGARAGTSCLRSLLASDHTIYLQQQEVGRTVETACSRADL